MGRQIKIVTLGATAVFLWAGSTAFADFTHGGFVIDRVDELTGVSYGHIAGHDFFILPGSDHGPDGGPEQIEAAHWSWVAISPTEAPAVTPVSYFIHDHGGAEAISLTQFDRIRDAAGVWNTSGANVVLTEFIIGGTEDIHVHNDSTSACGTFGAGGTLGCAETSFFTTHNPTGYPPGSGHPAVPGATHPQHLMTSFFGAHELTMLTGPSWYSGADPGSIGGTEHDYMTVVIQEFGHHLGLTHPDDPGVVPHGDMGTSPMLSTLLVGDVRRVLTGSDIAAIEHIYGVIPAPGALSLLALAGLVGYRRRRRPC